MVAALRERLERVRRRRGPDVRARIGRLSDELGDLVTFGVEVVDDAAFDATLARLRKAGFEATGSDELRAARRVERIATTDAPWGTPVEIVAGLERTPEPAPTPAMPGGFLTEGQGFGHLVIGTTAFDDSVRFVTDGLGMTRSDWIETELAPGIDRQELSQRRR